MLYSIRRKLTIILVICTIIAVLLSTLFVNLAVDNTFNKYIADNQEKRNERIVDSFTQIYMMDKKWTESSGKEMQHEGYMSNYCLTLLDSNKKQVWGMDPKEIENMNLTNINGVDNSGEYITNTFEIKAQNKIVGYIIVGQYQPVLLSEEDINFKNSININTIVSMLFTIAICALVSVLFSKQFSKPIKAVSDTSVDLSRGNYESMLDIKSNVFEINNLICSINVLGERLKYQDAIRKRLVSDISHEVRTPLNVLQNNIEAMIDGVFPVTTDRLNNLNEEVIRFGKLLNNLNCLKEFEEQKAVLNFEHIRLDELVSNVCQDFLIHSRNSNIDLMLSYDKEEDYSVSGDGDRLRQVFINIISNAFKFSKNNGKIWVKLSCDKQYIFIMIKDTGMGIKKADLPFIFERLYRGDKSRNKIEGSGIGLTIAKQILMLHSATINVESEEGIGTCITLRFNKDSVII